MHFGLIAWRSLLTVRKEKTPEVATSVHVGWIESDECTKLRDCSVRLVLAEQTMRLAKKGFRLTLRVRGLAEAANPHTAQQPQHGVYIATKSGRNRIATGRSALQKNNRKDGMRRSPSFRKRRQVRRSGAR